MHPEPQQPEAISSLNSGTEAHHQGLSPAGTAGSTTDCSEQVKISDRAAMTKPPTTSLVSNVSSGTGAAAGAGCDPACSSQTATTTRMTGAEAEALDVRPGADCQGNRAMGNTDIETDHEMAALVPPQAAPLHRLPQAALKPPCQQPLQAACHIASPHRTGKPLLPDVKDCSASGMPEASPLPGSSAVSDDNGRLSLPADAGPAGKTPYSDLAGADAELCQPCPAAPRAAGLLPVGITTYTGVG